MLACSPDAQQNTEQSCPCRPRRLAPARRSQSPPPAARVGPPSRKAGQAASFLLAGGCVQEVQWYKGQYSSWFVGDAVVPGAPASSSSPAQALELVFVAVLTLRPPPPPGRRSIHILHISPTSCRWRPVPCQPPRPAAPAAAAAGAGAGRAKHVSGPGADSEVRLEVPHRASAAWLSPQEAPA